MRLALILLLLSIAVTPGCATTNRQKILQTMVAAGVAGAVYGATRPMNPELNGAAYGSLAAAFGAFAGHMIWNSDEDADRFKKEASALRLELFHREKPILSAPAIFSAKIPDKFKRLVRPGEWKVSEIDQWVEDGENRLIHQNMIMELTPPSLAIDRK